jgi:hypothetical protein
MALLTLAGPGSVVDKVSRYGIVGSGFESRWRGKRFPLPHKILETLEPSVRWEPDSFPEVKRLGRSSDHPHSSRTEVKNKWSYIATAPLCLKDVLQGDLYLQTLGDECKL